MIDQGFKGLTQVKNVSKNPIFSCLENSSFDGSFENGEKLTILLYLMLSKDLDPCINVTCEYFAVCKAFDAFDARCVCEENCPSYEEPVCSSNSTTFKNKCIFELEMCRLKGNHTLYHPGSCTGET